MFSLEGKVAVVTGGASGFGLATARRFAKAGAKVIAADMTDAAGHEGIRAGLHARAAAGVI